MSEPRGGFSDASTLLGRDKEAPSLCIFLAALWAAALKANPSSAGPCVFHIDYLTGHSGNPATSLVKRASGRYYTGEVVGRRLAADAAIALHNAFPAEKSLSIADPFAGDGRLAEWLVEAWVHAGFPPIHWNVSLWDLDDVGLKVASARFRRLATSLKVKCKVDIKVLDSFAEACARGRSFDLVITNPPWELLKPDRRELESLAPTRRAKYIANMRAYDAWLAENYPLSQPKRKFAGWGTNLSRVGFEASLNLVRHGGIVAAVLPASFLADDQTCTLRQHLLEHHKLMAATYYPAEARLYDSADVASTAITLAVGGSPALTLPIRTHDAATGVLDHSLVELDPLVLRRVEYVVPISFGSKSLAILNSIALRFPTWQDLESSGALWAGREIDETGAARWLCRPPADGPLFIKGRMIGRYSRLENPSQVVVRPDWTPPVSVAFERIAWRDVSRPSQKRRVIASLIEAGTVAGNSLGVAYFRDHSEVPLLALLGVMNSTCFEFQLRAHLATGHVSLSSLRKVAVPSLAQMQKANVLASLVRAALASEDALAENADAYVAKEIYGLTELEYETILQSFGGLTTSERKALLYSYRDVSASESGRMRVAASRLAEPT